MKTSDWLMCGAALFLGVLIWLATVAWRVARSPTLGFGESSRWIWLGEGHPAVHRRVWR